MAERFRRSSAAPAPGIFVTGTDTGVGKTFVACALLHAFRRIGVRAVGMKPIAAGGIVAGEQRVNDDALALNLASAFQSDLSVVNPYCFSEPIAPHLAARDAGIDINIDRICGSYRQLGQNADFIVVEGAGGFLVPLGPKLLFADLARALGLPVVLVVGMRLGCLNHALLSAEAIALRGMSFAGWIANRIDPAMARWQDNLDDLRSRLPAPFLATVPFSKDGHTGALDGLDANAFLSRLADAFHA